MNIFGHDYHFLLTVGASADIADLCPEGDIERLNEALTGAYSHTLDVAMGMIIAMSKGYENNRELVDPGYVPKPLTRDQLLNLTQQEFAALEEEAVKAFAVSKERAVEVDTPEAKKN